MHEGISWSIQVYSFGERYTLHWIKAVEIKSTADHISH